MSKHSYVKTWKSTNHTRYIAGAALHLIGLMKSASLFS